MSAIESLKIARRSAEVYSGIWKKRNDHGTKTENKSIIYTNKLNITSAGKN